MQILNFDLEQEAWMEEGSCVYANTELFFPVGSSMKAIKQANEAKRRSRWRATLLPVKLGNYKRKKIMRAEKLVRDAVRFGRRGVNAISKGSWYALRAMLTALCVEDKRGRLLGGILDEEREEDAFRWDDVEDDYMSSPRKPGRPKKRKLRKQLIKDVLRGGD